MEETEEVDGDLMPRLTYPGDTGGGGGGGRRDMSISSSESRVEQRTYKEKQNHMDKSES